MLLELPGDSHDGCIFIYMAYDYFPRDSVSLQFKTIGNLFFAQGCGSNVSCKTTQVREGYVD